MTRMIAREAFAPRELPRLQRPIDLDFDDYGSGALAGEQGEIKKRLDESAAYGGRTEDLWRHEYMGIELTGRRRAFERGLHDLVPEIKDSLAFEDRRVRVAVQEVIIAPPDGADYWVGARLSVFKKTTLGYGMPPQAEGMTVEMRQPDEKVWLFTADFHRNEFRYPEAGGTWEGLGIFEWVSPAKLAVSLGKLGLRQAGKRLAKGAAGSAAGQRAGGASIGGGLKAPVSGTVGGQVATTAGKQAGKAAATDVADMGVAAVSLRLMHLRTVALQTAKQKGEHLGPLGFGNLIDDEFKALVKADIAASRLPGRLKVAARFKPGADVWDPDTKYGWDLTTATVKEVAGHDIRYLFGLKGKGPKKMHDGTQLKDVIPLVYKRSW